MVVTLRKYVQLPHSQIGVLKKKMDQVTKRMGDSSMEEVDLVIKDQQNGKEERIMR